MKPDHHTPIAVNLTQHSIECLDRLRASTGINRTDLINRAIQIYQVVQELTDDNGGLVIVREDGSRERVHIA